MFDSLKKWLDEQEVKLDHKRERATLGGRERERERERERRHYSRPEPIPRSYGGAPKSPSEGLKRGRVQSSSLTVARHEYCLHYGQSKAHISRNALVRANRPDPQRFLMSRTWWRWSGSGSTKTNCIFAMGQDLLFLGSLISLFRRSSRLITFQRSL